MWHLQLKEGKKKYKKILILYTDHSLVWVLQNPSVSNGDIKTALTQINRQT